MKALGYLVLIILDRLYYLLSFIVLTLGFGVSVIVNIREPVSLWTPQALLSCTWSFYLQPSDHSYINADPILYVLDVHKQSTIIFSKSDIFFFPALLY